MSVVGIPVDNFAAAKSLTLPGYASAVAAGARTRGKELYAANAAFQLMLNSNAFDASTIPLHRDLATAIYKLRDDGTLSGLGDDSYLDQVYTNDFWNQISSSPILNPPDDTPAIEPPGSSDNSWWTDILKTFATPIALGVGGRIAGQNPFAKPTVVVPATQMSSTTKLALAAGGLLVGGYVLSRILKKK
jgi:hypothetical protein